MSRVFQSGDFIYSYSVDNDEEVIIGDVERSIYSSNALINKQQLTDLNVPSFVIQNGFTYTVSTILQNAFCQIQTLESVFIPKTIVLIADAAFAESPKLKSVIFEEGSKLRRIYPRAFDRCPKIEQIIIPPSVEDIQRNAFSNFSMLSSVIYCGRSTFLTKNLIHPAEDAVNNDLKIFVVQGLYKASRFGNMSVIFTSECLVDPSIKGHLLTCRSKGWHFSFVYFVVVLL